MGDQPLLRRAPSCRGWFVPKHPVWNSTGLTP
jgi:hypothetical protein